MSTLPTTLDSYKITVSVYEAAVVYMDNMVCIMVKKDQTYGLCIAEIQDIILFAKYVDEVKTQQHELHDDLSIELCKYLMNKDNVNDKRFANIVSSLLDI